MAPQRYILLLIPASWKCYLRWQREEISPYRAKDGIKLTFLKGRFLWIIQLGPNPVISDLVRQMHREESKNRRLNHLGFS